MSAHAIYGENHRDHNTSHTATMSMCSECRGIKAAGYLRWDGVTRNSLTRCIVCDALWYLPDYAGSPGKPTADMEAPCVKL